MARSPGTLVTRPLLDRDGRPGDLVALDSHYSDYVYLCCGSDASLATGLTLVADIANAEMHHYPDMCTDVKRCALLWRDDLSEDTPELKILKREPPAPLGGLA